MKRLFLIPLSFLLLSSCLPVGPSDNGKVQNVRKGEIGELVINKAEIDKYYFQVNNEKINKTEIPYGAEVVLFVEGLNEFKEEQGKLAVDAGIYVYNDKNEEVAKLEDLYNEKYPKGVPVELAKSKISLSIQCRPPLAMNQKYKIVFKVKDKKSEAKVEISETFLMVPSPGIAYKESGLTSTGVYFFRNNVDNGTIVDQKLMIGDTLYAYIIGVNGAFEEDGKVYPDASLSLLNEFGDTVAEFKDMYGEYTKTGFSAEDFKTLNVFHLTISKDLIVGKKYSVVCKIGDKKVKEKTLEVKYDIIIK